MHAHQDIALFNSVACAAADYEGRGALSAIEIPIIRSSPSSVVVERSSQRTWRISTEDLKQQNRLDILATAKTESPSLQIVKSTQKLEEQMSRDSCLPVDVQPVLNLEILESDLLALVKALKQKEELQYAERNVFLEDSRLNQAKEESERRGNEISTVFSKHEKLEGELMQADLDLASQTRETEDLRLQIKEGDQEIPSAHSTLSQRR
ncbi:hypothetical protein DKX38_027810 [Salix brachista]|uniref:Uncharacterized protein n=1 Tax=Salix brachista TaxID=2182728 RepID=A0A5N5J800_9ROSI|nr:hypothetical protein DKX38_027810 [Salix brachista]